MTRVKICGITNISDARAAVAAGADAIGFVFAPSPRQITPPAAAAIRTQLGNTVTVVGVFVSESAPEIAQIALYCSLDYCQIYGEISEQLRTTLGSRLIPAITLNGGDLFAALRHLAGQTVLFDAPHRNRNDMTTVPFDWNLARAAHGICRIILAGGLNVDNIESALETARPHAVDVSSGVEIRPGVKDHEKISQFIQRIRTWDSRTSGGISVDSADDLFLKR